MVFFRLSLAVSLGFVLSACVALPQQVVRQQTVAQLLSDKTWQQSHGTSLESGELVLSQSLLALFDNADLNIVVEKALENNLDLQLAAERLRESGFLNQMGQANRWPEADLDLNVNRSKDVSAVADGGESTRRTDYSANIAVSWELDLWGRLHQQRQAQQAKTESLLQDFHAARNSIAARVMQLWFTNISQTERVQIEQLRVQQLERLQMLVRQRYQDGLADLSELDDVRAKKMQFQASLLEQRQLLTESQYQLQALLGEYPEHLDTQNSKLSSSQVVDDFLTITLPPVAVGIPAHVIHRRPDVQAAWQAVNAANANAKADYWAMYPSIELTGQFGKNGTSLRRLMDQPSIWNVLTMIKVPLFNAGRLKNNYRAAKSRAEQDYIVFLQRILNALHEVEVALSQGESLIEQEKALRAAAQLARENASRAEFDYRFGRIKLEDYLDHQVNALDVLIQLVELSNQRLQNRVTLGLALGQGV